LPKIVIIKSSLAQTRNQYRKYTYISKRYEHTSKKRNASQKDNLYIWLGKSFV